MTGEFSMPLEVPTTGALRRGAVSLLLGAGFTALLFLGLAHIEHAAPEEQEPVFNDLLTAALPMEPPPPPAPRSGPSAPEAPPMPVSASLGVKTGDIGAPVKVFSSLREVSQLLPARTLTPSMAALTQAHYSELRPKMDLSPEFQRIYQVAEVDERPRALIQSKPFVPGVVRNGATELQATLLFVVDTAGAVTSVRILHTSGNKYFDEIIEDCVKRGWVFSPAVKQGKKVKCLIQNAVVVRWSSSPF